MAQDPQHNPRKPAACGEGCPYNASSPLLLKLYIANSSPISLQAIGNLTALLRSLPAACYQLEVIDALDDPLRSVRDGVLVTPTLLKLAPAPTLSLLGNLHDLAQVARLLGIVEEDE